MSRNQRIALVVAALVVAVAAFVIAQPGDDEEDGGATSTTPARTEAEPTPEQAPTAVEPPPPEVTRIQLRGGAVVGGAKTIEAEAGETVRIVVRADQPDEIHLHGYDITQEAAPGQPARFRFKADAEGEFVLESHVAEDAGRDPLIARLLVGPS